MNRFVPLVLIVCGGIAPLDQGFAEPLLPGALVTEFGVAGVARSNFGGLNVGNRMAIQPDGKLVMVGARHLPGGSPSLVCRYHGDGSADHGFGTAGRVFSSFLEHSEARDVSILHDRIYVGGTTWSGSDPISTSRMFVARYRMDGELDSSFGAGGVRVVAAGSGAVAVSMAVAADGSVILGGMPVVGYLGPVLAKVLADGTVDGSFGTSGVAFHPLDLGFYFFGGLAATDDGSVFVVGTRDLLGARDWVMTRCLGDGSLDGSFGSGGVVIYDSGTNDEAGAVMAHPLGGYWVAGTTNAMSRWVMAHVLDDGSLNPGFGTSGMAGVSVGAPTTSSVMAMWVQENGRLVMTGTISETESGSGDRLVDMLAVRLTSGGSADSSFGTGGLRRVDLGGNDWGMTSALLADGDVLLGGYSDPGRANGNPPTSGEFTMVRLRGDRTLYGQWLDGAGVGLANQGWAATPFADGVPNLLKYASDLNGSGPGGLVLQEGVGTSGLPALRPRWEGTSRVFRFEYLRRTGSGLFYFPEMSRSLNGDSWEGLEASPVVSPIDGQWERVVIEEPVPMDWTAGGFGRVRIVPP